MQQQHYEEDIIIDEVAEFDEPEPEPEPLNEVELQEQRAVRAVRAQRERIRRKNNRMDDLFENARVECFNDSARMLGMVPKLAKRYPSISEDDLREYFNGMWELYAPHVEEVTRKNNWRWFILATRTDLYRDIVEQMIRSIPVILYGRMEVKGIYVQEHPMVLKRPADCILDEIMKKKDIKDLRTFIGIVATNQSRWVKPQHLLELADIGLDAWIEKYYIEVPDDIV